MSDPCVNKRRRNCFSSPSYSPCPVVGVSKMRGGGASLAGGGASLGAVASPIVVVDNTHRSGASLPGDGVRLARGAASPLGRGGASLPGGGASLGAGQELSPPHYAHRKHSYSADDVFSPAPSLSPSHSPAFDFSLHYIPEEYGVVKGVERQGYSNTLSNTLSREAIDLLNGYRRSKKGELLY